MLDLNDFFYFVQVVERRGFTAEGRAAQLDREKTKRQQRSLRHAKSTLHSGRCATWKSTP
jgi:hypothetical protein